MGFSKEFKDDKRMMEWYNDKVEKWSEDKIMKLFVEIRNISSKEHMPETLALSTGKGGFDIAKADVEYTPNGSIKIKIPFYSSVKKTLKIPKKLHSTAVYFFRLPNWFNENPDVFLLCKHYIEELEEFVRQAEKKLRKEKKSHD